MGFYYQVRGETKSKTGEIRDLNNPPELFLTDGSRDKLKNKAVYFIRNPVSLNFKEINVQGSNDAEVIWGEISTSSLKSLDILVNTVFPKLVLSMESSEWENVIKNK